MEQAIVKRVHRREKADLIFRQLLDEAGHIARIGYQQVDATGPHAKQIAGGEREHVIERQRANDEEFIDDGRLLQGGLQPGIVLQNVGENVAMEQRRAFGKAGSAARVLKEGDVVESELRLAELQVAARGDRVIEF